MNRTLLVMIGSLLSLAAMFLLLARGGASPRSGADATAVVSETSAEPLILFCAASNRAVIEQIRADYQAEYSREVEVQYGASQTILSQMQISKSGDLYLPADDSFLELACQQELVAEVLPIARMQAGVAVRRGNPRQIKALDDLLRDDVRLVQASAEAAAIGKLTREALGSAGLWERLERATDGMRTTVTEAANDVLVDAADAAIVYDAVLHTYPELEFIEIPELAAASSQVSVGVIRGTQQPQAALHFARYVTARDRGMERYQQHGFRVSGGDVWSDVPELKLFAGSMLRPAIEDTVARFEQREGVRIDTVYNGCGILVAQMKAGQVPDAYFACDTEFMVQVPDLFPEPVDVSQNELVILVHKGNPHNIATLRDLTKQGLRVGIGHEKQCAMGWLTQNTFREGGVQQEVMANVTVQTPTGDMLVNQLKTGSLDAAVAYLSNAAGSGDVLDAIRIQGLKCSVATQPYAVQPDSPHALTASRLFEQICSAESKASFAAEGFGWKLDSQRPAQPAGDDD
jgi:ABC-type molybdate transport system substrate-binding protein